MTRYAERTQVNSQQSRNEIERLVERYGARRFIYGWEDDRAIIGFEMHNRQIKLVLPLPSREEFRFTETGRERTVNSERQAYEQAVRQRWRALALVVKAKLEAVETGITDFETKWLAHIVLPDGRTYGEWAIPQIADVYRTGQIYRAARRRRSCCRSGSHDRF